jgi:putative transposase
VTRDLKRYQKNGDFHFITFSCYHRKPLLKSPQARYCFEQALERVRNWYGLFICGYVVMPEHVHLLVNEPARGTLSSVIQMLKQISAKNLQPAGNSPFWQARYYDFNVCTDRRRIEKLRYIHRNPVKRGLAAKPEDWPWSSFLHYTTGLSGPVKIAAPPTLSPKTRETGGAPGTGL